ncbi:TPA: DNA polymerase IV [Vibrio parahaemolyticus]|uniref:DNA polymerase IV n=1 Tax=Vibrio parahaemolyticus TaxID=670 RepID=A0AAW8Q265_VIBPH|nr:MULTISPECIES: DNA polymerase IV [Vibrio]EGQ8539131.1 DNA polymerase IV [Vibrio parahaemolyticus]EGR2298809.1 DNA polymerase IV [Vibrio parahaemolyticus]EGR3250183.1 DNA polymerase IV [Vibrio parahaemolyticus]EIZ4248482.1 DNA polymerase IV [Vibrio parahaemolyticus]EJI6685104.1 DNA polymerase IV [Vibrio parahaemolyticus]
MQRKIIHIDLDCYYAAIEARDNPELRNIPMAIGGKNGRGVISTCNYEARAFGVRSAMPTSKALQLCPNLTVVAGDMEKYRQVSKQIHEIFGRYTSVIEPLSLDEAYLDVSDSQLFMGSATLIAEDIRRTIERELKITASAGVSPLKFVSKVASDVNKPNGICVVTPSEIQSFIDVLDLGKINGVGKVTLEKLNNLGLFKGKDVKELDKSTLISQFGKFGNTLWERCNGIDDRPVVVERVRKSVGVERTFLADIHTLDECIEAICSLYSELEFRLKKVLVGKTISRLGIKLKFSDFQQTTVEHKHNELERDFFIRLCEEALSRSNGRGIRLVGLSVGIEPTVPNELNRQMSLPL